MGEAHPRNVDGLTTAAAATAARAPPPRPTGAPKWLKPAIAAAEGGREPASTVRRQRVLPDCQ